MGVCARGCVQRRVSSSFGPDRAPIFLLRLSLRGLYVLTGHWPQRRRWLVQYRPALRDTSTYIKDNTWLQTRWLAACCMACEETVRPWVVGCTCKWRLRMINAVRDPRSSIRPIMAACHVRQGPRDSFIRFEIVVKTRQPATPTPASVFSY